MSMALFFFVTKHCARPCSDYYISQGIGFMSCGRSGALKFYEASKLKAGRQHGRHVSISVASQICFTDTLALCRMINNSSLDFRHIFHKASGCRHLNTLLYPEQTSKGSEKSMPTLSDSVASRMVEALLRMRLLTPLECANHEQACEMLVR